MPSNTKEVALEEAIERHLTERHGYHSGQPADFDKEFAVDTVRFWDFLESTQPRELDKLKRYADWRARILTRYNNLVKKRGVLDLLRKGLKVEDAQLELFYQPPTGASGSRVRRQFDANQWSITRQLRYHRQQPGQELDLALFVNGIPLLTVELKNAWTHQTARAQGIKQYRTERDAGEPLLQFGRCLVHLAVDTDEAWMTTRLNGKDTFFLPFNQGTDQDGAGNPVNPAGHKTAYLWEDVFSPLSLAAIIQHFMLFEVPEELRKKPRAGIALSKKTLIFPRYHQRDVVRQLVGDAERRGAGHTYLIQHSAGSGKSNSITWLAYQLIDAYRANADRPVFDSVIVVTDRRLLDQQIRDNIREFSQMTGVVAWAKKSTDLRRAMEQGKRIIITTIQKFPFVVEEIGDLSDRQFAVIIDEAHSSQSGQAAAKMNEAMGVSDVATPTYAGADAGAMFEEEEPVEDGQDLVNRAMLARKMRDNASYYAFTATPKNTTFERFGERRADGTFHAHHLYSMKQAIEEEFILDVLRNYTTYRSYYEIEKSVAENPNFQSDKAQARLKAFVESDARTIEAKAGVMLDHFHDQVVKPGKLMGRAKGMVVTQSIRSAIRYYLAIKELLRAKGEPFRILIAFSGEKIVDGIPYTEAGMNGFPESETRDAFDRDEYRLLIVANKYLTGFDQKKLTAMYVDKKLQGVLAVQALSRLNRANKKLKKRPEDLFVLDFFNTAEEIKTAFDPFYRGTSLSGPTDVSVLHDLIDALDGYGIYTWQEVIHFTEQFFAGVDGEVLSPLVDVVAERFDRQLEEDQKADVKIKAKQFVKVYGQMASIIDFQVLQWEQTYWFLKFLIPKLRVPRAPDDLDNILDSVDLSTYGLERTRLDQPIALDDADSEVDPQNPNLRGVHGTNSEEEALDLIIRSFNEKYFAPLGGTPEENRVRILSYARHITDHPDMSHKVLDNPDPQTSELAFDKIYDDVMAQKRREDLDFYRRLAKDDAARADFKNLLRRLVG